MKRNKYKQLMKEYLALRRKVDQAYTSMYREYKIADDFTMRVMLVNLNEQVWDIIEPDEINDSKLHYTYCYWHNNKRAYTNAQFIIGRDLTKEQLEKINFYKEKIELWNKNKLDKLPPSDV